MNSTNATRVAKLLGIALLSPFVGLDNSVGQSTQSYPGEIRLALVKRPQEPIAIGTRVTLSMSIAYEDLPRGARIYAHLMTLAGDKWMTAGAAELSGSDIRLSFSGGFSESESDLFQIAQQNYPINKPIDKDTIATMVKGFGIDQENSVKFADAIASSEAGYDLTLAFLASVADQSSGFAEATLTFTVPHYSNYYDGILITPFVFQYDSKGTPTVHISSDNMPPIRLSVAPNRPRLQKKDNRPLTAQEIGGSVEIVSYSPSNAVVYTGSRNVLKLDIAYEGLSPGASVYVAPVPSDQGKYIFGRYVLTLPGISGVVKPTVLDAQSPAYGIAIENQPISFPLTHGQTLEAGHIGTVSRGGSGRLSGQLSFIPPAYPNRYQRVHLIPVLLVSTRKGLAVLIESDRLTGPRVLVSDGY